MSDDESPMLAAEIARVTWLDLRQHAERNGLFLVHGEPTLAEVGAAIAADERPAVEAWLAAGNLARPTTAEHEAWETDLSRPFDFVIVQPFVLAKPVDD